MEVGRPQRRHLVLIAVILLAAACSSNPEGRADFAAADAAGSPSARWSPCGDGLECAEVTVPVDYENPTGSQIDIAMVRRPASGDRRGAIFVNPGGPGGSGIDFVTGGLRFDSETMAAYDLIGFDPRGVGASNGLTCDVDRADGPLPDHSPDDAGEADALDDYARRIAERCGNEDATLLAHLQTENVARDLDALRAAVGEEELDYYGFSFGTLIGLVYADLFPDRVGHMVLDGVVDPTSSLDELLLQQAVAFDHAFQLLDRACTGSLSCPAGGIVATYDRVLDELERTGPRGEVGPTEFEAAALLTLYDDSLWPIYADALNAAAGGDFGPIERLSDAFHSSVSFISYAAVECTDGPRPADAEQWDRLAADLTASAPRFGSWVANELRLCAYWPFPAGPGRGPISAPGAAPILVIGTTNDPATPLANAEAVAAQLDRSALVVLEADRHTAYQAGNQCVIDVVQAYFNADEVPATTITCAVG